MTLTSKTAKATAVRRLLAHYRQACEETRAAGRRWYADAGLEAERFAAFAGVTREQAASVIAALSPQVSWEWNLRLAADVLLHGRRDGHFRQCLATAERARCEGFAALNGPKTSAFARNIAGDLEHVTVDRHMLAAVGLPKSTALTRKTYALLADAIAAAARRVGETPADFQAIVWLQVR